jgi:uncharacterized protein (UPF0264 family)
MLSGTKPRFLASVRNCEEAHLAASLGAELIDLKDPSQGALGAVDTAEQRRIVAQLGSVGGWRPPLSATVGDLPFEPGVLERAIRLTAACGVDIVKFGIYASGETARLGLRELDRRLAEPPSAQLVALLLADRLDGLDEVLFLARAVLQVRGVKGVMLDTAAKGSRARALPDVLDCADLTRFVAEVHECGGFAGLAGSLGIEHVAPLVATGADILGFRGALCGGSRTEALAEPAFLGVHGRLKAARASSRAAVLAA